LKIGVVPAAGQGRRLGYLSSILPKSLFPLYDRPIIHHVMNNLQLLGVNSVYVIVNFQKDKIVEYFDRLADSIGIDVNFVVQRKLTGIADAIALTRGYFKEPFLCILGDDVTLGELSPFVDLFIRNDSVVAEVLANERDESMLKRTCCVELAENGLISRIAEKPKRPFSHLRGCGVYAFRDDIFDFISRTPRSRKRGEKEITDVIAEAAKHKLATGWILRGRNFNINSYEDLFTAWNHLRREVGLFGKFNHR